MKFKNGGFMSLNLKSIRTFLAKYASYCAIYAVPMFHQNAQADVVYSIAGDEVSVPILSGRGSLLELPRPVISIATPSRYYKIDPQNAIVDPHTGVATDVRMFLVTPVKNSQQEKVTFILETGEHVTVNMFPSSRAQNSYQIKFPSSGLPFSNAYSTFMQNEKGMMESMLKDSADPGYSREITNIDVEFYQYKDDINIKLVRRFSGAGLTGWVFTVINKTDKELKLNPVALEVGVPNRAAMFQVDHKTLEPCAINASTNPKSESCVTAMRIVVRDSIPAIPSSSSDFPFYLEKQDKTTNAQSSNPAPAQVTMK